MKYLESLPKTKLEQLGGALASKLLMSMPNCGELYERNSPQIFEDKDGTSVYLSIGGCFPETEFEHWVWGIDNFHFDEIIPDDYGTDFDYEHPKFPGNFEEVKKFYFEYMKNQFPGYVQDFEKSRRADISQMKSQKTQEAKEKYDYEIQEIKSQEQEMNKLLDKDLRILNSEKEKERI